VCLTTPPTGQPECPGLILVTAVMTLAVAVLIDPALSQIDRYLFIANQARISHSLHHRRPPTPMLRTHFHRRQKLSSKKLDFPVVMPPKRPAVFAGDGVLMMGTTLKGWQFAAILHHPWAYADSMCIVGPDSVFSLEIPLLDSATGRPTCRQEDPASALPFPYFEKVLKCHRNGRLSGRTSIRRVKNSNFSREKSQKT